MATPPQRATRAPPHPTVSRDGGCVALFEDPGAKPALSSLRVLSLSRNPIADRGLGALTAAITCEASSRPMGCLRFLYVDGHDGSQASSDELLGTAGVRLIYCQARLSL